jgi:hypothetical protein
MKEPNNDWSELEAAWRAHDADPQLMESTLRSRMQAQKLLVLHATGEGLSFLVAVGVWIWVALHSHKPLFGWLMLGVLFLYEGFALWVRRNEPVSDTVNVLDRLDLAIEQESRVVRSMQLGNAVAMLALGGLVIGTVYSVRPHEALGDFSTGLFIAIGCFGAYVFVMHAVIIVHARRVRARLERLETIRRVLRAP